MPTSSVPVAAQICELPASTAPDDPHKLAPMILDVAGIVDGDIRRGRDLGGAANPVLDLSVTAARPRSKAFGESFRRRRDRDHRDIGIGLAHCVHHGARYIDDDRAPGADIAIDRPGQAVAMAMRLPMDRELVPRERLPEGFKANLLVVFKR